MSDTLIKVEGLSKKFCTSLKRGILYGTYDAVRDSMIYVKMELFNRFLISAAATSTTQKALIGLVEDSIVGRYA